MATPAKGAICPEDSSSDCGQEDAGAWVVRVWKREPQSPLLGTSCVPWQGLSSVTAFRPRATEANAARPDRRGVKCRRRSESGPRGSTAGLAPLQSAGFGS